MKIIGDLIKDRIANTLWPTLGAVEDTLGEELRPIRENAERGRSLVFHPWLSEQANATAAVNGAVAEWKWDQSS